MAYHQDSTNPSGVRKDAAEAVQCRGEARHAQPLRILCACSAHDDPASTCERRPESRFAQVNVSRADSSAVPPIRTTAHTDESALNFLRYFAGAYKGRTI